MRQHQKKSDEIPPGAGNNKRTLPKNSSNKKQNNDGARSIVQRQISAPAAEAVRAKSGHDTSHAI